MEQHVHLADGPGDLLLHRTARLGLPRLKMAARSCFTVGAAALRARRGRALGVNDGGRTRARQRGSSKRRLQCGFSGPRVLARPLGEVPLRHWRSPQPRCGAIEEPPQILGRRSQEDCREPRVVVGVRGGGSQLTGDPQRHDQDVAPLSGKRRSKRRTATPSLVGVAGQCLTPEPHGLAGAASALEDNPTCLEARAVETLVRVHVLADGAAVDRDTGKHAPRSRVAEDLGAQLEVGRRGGVAAHRAGGHSGVDAD